MSQGRMQPRYPTPGPVFSYEISEEDSQVLVHLNGNVVSLKITSGDGPAGWCRSKGGSLLPFAYAWVGNNLHLWLDGDIFIFQPAKQRGRRPADATAPGGDVTAPVPGKILQILVQVGDAVEPYHPVLMPESMKMEHLLRAPGGGTVDRVLAEEGQQVERGDVLVKMKPWV